MGCKTVPKCMCADSFGQPGFANRRLNGLIDDAGVDMMTPGYSATRINGKGSGWKDVLPAPFSGGMGIFPGQGMGQIAFAGPQDRSKRLRSFFHHLKDAPGTSFCEIEQFFLSNHSKTFRCGSNNDEAA